MTVVVITKATASLFVLRTNFNLTSSCIFSLGFGANGKESILSRTLFFNL